MRREPQDLGHVVSKGLIATQGCEDYNCHQAASPRASAEATRGEGNDLQDQADSSPVKQGYPTLLF